jgi:uncharacterized phage infection (PIP) family protein YhgE
MKINDKISQLKTTIQEIKNISEKLGSGNDFETKIDQLNKEILMLKKGISASVEELEEFLEEENAKS